MPLDETTAREFRRIYRQHSSDGTPWHDTKAEFARLFGRWPDPGEAEHLVTLAHIEGRELAGQSYDYTSQCWRDERGERVVD